MEDSLVNEIIWEVKAYINRKVSFECVCRYVVNWSLKFYLHFSFHAIYHVKAYVNVSVHHGVPDIYNSLLTNDLKNGVYLLYITSSTLNQIHYNVWLIAV